MAITILNKFSIEINVFLFTYLFVFNFSPFFASNMNSYPTSSTSTSPAGSSIASSIGEVKPISANYPYFGQFNLDCSPWKTEGHLWICDIMFKIIFGPKMNVYIWWYSSRHGGLTYTQYVWILIFPISY